MIKYLIKVYHKRGLLWMIRWAYYAYYKEPKLRKDRIKTGNLYLLPVWYWEFQKNSKYYDNGLKISKIVKRGISKKLTKKQRKKEKALDKESSGMVI